MCARLSAILRENSFAVPGDTATEPLQPERQQERDSSLRNSYEICEPNSSVACETSQ